MIKIENSFIAICDTCQDSKVGKSHKLQFHIFVEKLKIEGWEFVIRELHSFPYKSEDVKKTTCPKCEAKRKAELCKSKNIWDRINGGYYDDKSRMQFKNDALEHVGLTNHPKAEKVFKMAWEHGEFFYGYLQYMQRLRKQKENDQNRHANGYGHFLCWLEELSVLLK
jgi:hypothetical protein